jgi:raffinose/stachyose/melibiose transport system permease protein
MSTSVLEQAPVVVRPPRPRRRPRKGVLASTILLWVYAAAALAPLVIMALGSLRTEQQLADKPIGFPLHPAFENYAKAWSEGGWARASRCWPPIRWRASASAAGAC